MADNRQSQSWWQTMPGVITAIAGLVTAVGGLLTILLQAGVIGDSRSEPKSIAEAAAPAPPAGRPVANAPGENPEPGLDALESRLEDVNIQLSTGTNDDRARVRGYMSDPENAYRLLASGCLDLLAGRRLKRPAHLDMIDKWYTLAVGSDRYTSEAGTVRAAELADAIVKATNEIHGTNAGSFEQLLEPRP